MPITYSRVVATCRGSCGSEDAETLKEWIGERACVLVDLAETSHLHTAVVQVLLASPSCVIAQAPKDPLLCAVLAPALARNPVRERAAADAAEEQADAA